MVWGGNPHLKNPIGIDIIRVRKPRNYKKVFVMDAQDLRFKSKTFDTITVGCVIAHVENPSLFLRNLRRVLKDNGTVLLTIPNPISPVTIIPNSLRPLHHAAKQHISVIPPRNLISLFDHTGFKVIKLIPLGIEIPYRPQLERLLHVPLGVKKLRAPFPLAQESLYVLKKKPLKKDKVLVTGD